MQIPPPEIRQAWPKPNYVNPETRGPANVIVNCVLYPLVCLVLILRIFTRMYILKGFGLDDVLILVAWIPTTAFFVVSLLADLHFQWDRHVYDITLDHVVPGLKMVLAIQVVFAVAATLTKLSMLVLVCRITAVRTSGIWPKITTGALIVVAIQGSVFVITVIFQCRPPWDYWAVTPDPQPNCVDQTSSLLIAGIINTLTDFLVVLLPLHTVWSIQLPKRQQVIVTVILGFGLCSCFAGVVRTYYTYQVTTAWDQTWMSYPVWMTSGIELYIGVICASVPATKPFFFSYLPSLLNGPSTALLSNPASAYINTPLPSPSCDSLSQSSTFCSPDHAISKAESWIGEGRLEAYSIKEDEEQTKDGYRERIPISIWKKENST